MERRKHASVKYNRQQRCLIFGSDLIARTDGSFAFEMIYSQKFIVNEKKKKDRLACFQRERDAWSSTLQINEDVKTTSGSTSGTFAAQTFD